MIDELLVHISAPTTRQGDEQYQALAEAYLEFEPRSPQRTSLRQSNALNQPASSRPDDATAPNQGSSFLGTADTSILSASKDSYGSFPSYLSSVGLKTPTPAVDGWNHNVEDDLPPTSSQIPEPGDLHNKNWRRTLRSSSKKRRRSDKWLHNSSDIDVGFIEDTQVAAADVQSQPQDSYLMESDGASENDTNGDQIMDDTIETLVAPTPDTKDPQRRRSKRLEVATRVAETPVSSKSSAVTTLPEPAGPGNMLRSSLLPPKNRIDGQKDIEESWESFPPPIDFTKVESIVYPPEPKVSTAQPGTLPSQITPLLAALKQQSPTRFKPIKRLKKPKPDDRGYWLINCSRWSTQFQQLFWDDISSQVSNGYLGWGVMLFREGGTVFSLGEIKLYCWGEIVEHMWLVLWLASEGKICDCGLKWIDADGNSAFVMS